MVVYNEVVQERGGLPLSRLQIQRPEMQNVFFEVGINDVLFHCDVVLPERFSKDQKFSRFVSSDMYVVVDFLTTRYPTEARVTMQSGFVDGEGYLMRNVSKISSGHRPDGKRFFICDFDGEQVVVGATDDVSILGQTKLVWPRQPPLSWESLESTRDISF